MIPLRLLLVVALLFGIALVGRVYRGWRDGLRSERPHLPLVPASLRGGGERTWVVFTTPLCAACGPVEAALRASDPGAHVVRVDATAEPVLAGAFRVRAAPTALLADADGRVKARLVGAEAVDRYVRRPA